MSAANPIGSTAFDRVVDALERAGMKQQGRSWTCPAHDDRSPSLSVTAADGQCLVHCFAGCEPDAIVGSIGLSIPDLFDTPRLSSRPDLIERTARRNTKPSKASEPNWIHRDLDAVKAAVERATKGKVVARYDYEDEQRDVVLCVFRTDRKDFRQASPEGAGWKLSTAGVRLVPFHLPELISAVAAGDTIHIVEGEKDVLAIEAAGGVATCNPMGAGKGRGKDPAQYAEVFRGAELVRVVADQDEPGRKHAQAWADVLRPLVKSIEILEPIEGKDAADALAAGHSLETAFRHIEEPDFEPLRPFEVRYGPEMPTEALPDALREMVDTTAEAFQVPASAVGAWVLGTISACVARRFEAIPRPGWVEPLNLFTVAALPPASRKSAAINRCTGPLIEFERLRNEANREERERCAGVVSMLEKRVAALEKSYARAAADAADASAEDVAAARGKLAEARMALNAVKPIQLYSSDTTPEAAADRMAQHGERLAIVSAEGAEFFSLMRRYYADGHANQDFYLKAHVGDPVRVDRKGAASISLARPALSTVLAVQPSVVDSIREDVELNQRGMVARFLFAVPEPTVGSRRIAPDPIPERVSERYGRLVRLLLETGGDAIPLRFESDANRELQQFERDLEPRLHPESGDLGAMGEWAGKLSGLVVRLAGLIHCTEMAGRGLHPNEGHGDDGGVIGVDALRRAITLGEWALEHALVALAPAEANDAEAARLWRWVRGRSDPSAPFSARDAFTETKRRGDSMETFVRPAMANLTRRGFLRPQPVRAPSVVGGRPPSPEYAPNPAALRLR